MNAIKKAVINTIRAVLYFGIAIIALGIGLAFTPAESDGGAAVLIATLATIIAPIVFAAMRSGEAKALYLPFAGGVLVVSLVMLAGIPRIGIEHRTPVVLGKESIEVEIDRLLDECRALSVACDDEVAAARDCSISEAAVICSKRVRADVAGDLAVAKAERDAKLAAAEAERRERNEKAAAERRKQREAAAALGVWEVYNYNDDFNGGGKFARVNGVVVKTDTPFPGKAMIEVVKPDGDDLFANVWIGEGYICAIDYDLKGDVILDGDQRESITFRVAKNNEYLHIKASSYWVKKFGEHRQMKLRLVDDCGHETRVEFNIQGRPKLTS